MTKRFGLTAIVLALCAGAATAGGGKISWTEPKNEKHFDQVQAECTQFGRPMVVYFTSDS